MEVPTQHIPQQHSFLYTEVYSSKSTPSSKHTNGWIHSNSSTYQGVEVSGWQACHKGADVGTQVLIECHLPAAVGEG